LRKEQPPLIITDEIPGSVEAVISELERLGRPPVVFRPSLVINQSERLTLDVALNGDVRLDLPGRVVRPSVHTRVLLRRPAFPKATGDSATDRFVERQTRSVLKSIYSLPIVWMNDYFAAERVEGNKPYQQILAARAGLTTIPSLCTNNPDQFVRFAESLNSDVAVKATESWWAELEGEGTAVGTYTRRLSIKEALLLAKHVAFAPVLVQPYVEKRFELRVTAVGSRLFTCRIESQASPRTRIDWRHYDFENVSHTVEMLPRKIEEALGGFMMAAGLVFGALDLIVGVDGIIYFVEVNPSGQYGWIEHLTGLPISETIAHWLIDIG
jgi:glutathione synthase/RimK-type ligase-like ATP-grasp enzyme